MLLNGKLLCMDPTTGRTLDAVGQRLKQLRLETDVLTKA
jgi:hypothetical protein